MNIGGKKIDVPDWTKEDYLGVEPFEWLYKFKDSEFALLQLRDAIKLKAAAVGVNNFIKKWNLYLKSMAPQKASITDNVTAFTDQPIELYCNEYQCDDYGVTTEDRYGGEVLVCRHPIMPVSRLINVDTGETKLEIAFKRNNRWKSNIFPKDTLASSQKIIELSKYDMAVDSENAKLLVRYITCLESENYDKLGETKSVGRMGWIRDYGFAPYVEGLRFDGDMSFRSMFESIRNRGSYEKWLEAMHGIRKYGNIARIQMAASFASVLVEPLDCLPFFVHVWGGTEAGKTVGLMVAASVWADPALGTYIHTFNSTAVGQEMAAGFVNSLPLCIDELQVVKDRKSFDDIIYMLTEGIGKSRGAKAGGLQRLQTWRNCILSTGEMPISNANSGGGAVNRIVEIDCKDERLFEGPREIASCIRRNYGFAGRLFIEKLIENMGEAKSLYSEFYGALQAGETTEKQAMAAALILTADRLSERWIFKDGITLSIKDIEVHLTTKDEMNVNARALDWVFDFVASNPAKFGAVEGYIGDRWGETDESYIYMIKSVFDKQMGDAGFNSGAFLSWAKRRGILETEPGRNVKKKRIRGTDVRAWCVCLRRDAAGDGEERDLDDELPL